MWERLSERQRHVGLLLIEGHTDKEIAQVLGVEPVTVKRHMMGIRARLEARNRVDAAVKLAVTRRVDSAE